MPPVLTDALAIDAILDDTRVGVWQFDIATRQLSGSDMASAPTLRPSITIGTPA